MTKHDDDGKRAYSNLASKYISALGSMEDMDPLDATLIASWGRSVVGPILDAGSGPGHWTAFLRDQGCEASGIDMVPEFVDSARERFPLVSFAEGDLLVLPFEDASFGGVLAWYSLIHMRADLRGRAIEELARVLRPDGTILVAAFLGSQDIPFSHAVTEAFYWSERGLADQLGSAGFEVTSTHTRSSEGSRPHLAVLARRV